MMPDGIPAPASGASTPAMTPFSSGIATPHGASTNGKVADYLSAGLGSKFGRVKEKKYFGGSKALDALSKLIISVESFFHPTNSGKWTNDLTAFVKYLVYEFNKRWHEEQKQDCKTPKVSLVYPCDTVPSNFPNSLSDSPRLCDGNSSAVSALSHSSPSSPRMTRPYLMYRAHSSLWSSWNLI